MRFFGADRMNEIVKYHNDLSNQIIIKTLNANELNFFMAI